MINCKNSYIRNTFDIAIAMSNLYTSIETSNTYLIDITFAIKYT